MGNVIGEEGPMQMDKDLCLLPGNPQNPGLQLPTDTDLVRLQREDKHLRRISEYLDGKSKQRAMIPPHELERYCLTQEGVLFREGPMLSKQARNRKKKREKEAAKKGLNALQDPEGDGDKTKSQSTRQQMIPAVGNIRASLMRYFHG